MTTISHDTQYEAPTLMVDAVVFRLHNNTLEVLLVKRAREPFKGKLSLPGGYMPKGETTKQALERVLLEKTSLSLQDDLPYIEQLYTFDTVSRDPRGHAVSVTYMAYGSKLDEDKLSNEVSFYPVNDLPSLAYDHADIVHYAHQRLITRLTHTNAIAAFLPQEFSLTDLQTAYEVVFGKSFDKRNFRKKILSFNMIEQTGSQRRDGPHRPARLFRFKTHDLESLGKHFIGG